LNRKLQDVYRQHRQGMFSLALSITRSRVQAEDAVQNAFVNLVKQELPSGVDLVPYAFQAVRFASLDSLRRQKRERALEQSLFNGDIAVSKQDDSPLEDVLTAERDRILRQAVDGLPTGEREAIVLKAFAGLTFEQAGKAASVPAKTIATRYRRALEKLERKLGGEA